MWKVDDIYNMPAQKRKRLRLGKSRGRYAVEGKRSFSRERLLEFLKEKGYKTRDALRAGRVKGEPNSFDYEKEFGSWQVAVNEAFGVRNETEEKRLRYMVKCVIKFDLWTWRSYQEARVEAPTVIPSMHEVKKLWGSYANMRWTARMSSFKKSLEDYLKLWRRLGRKPDMADCEKHGLNMDRPINHFGSKSEMDSFLEGKK